MKRLLLLLAALFILGCGAHSEKHWSYEGDTGPAYWAELNSEYRDALGSSQSPIDITPALAKPSRDSAVNIYYVDGAFTIANNGHTIELAPIHKGESYIILDGERYALQQFHFHTPSEHAVNFAIYDMEIHFVNRSADGKLAVMGVFCSTGSINKTLLEVWRNMPVREQEPLALPDMVAVTRLIPQGGRVYRYEGSLTTPPTKEGVSWVVFDTPIEVSRIQVSKFGFVIGESARPLQLLGGRIVTSYDNKWSHEFSDEAAIGIK